jgi:hypothetical protein
MEVQSKSQAKRIAVQKKKKANCYECKFRGSLVGDAHSTCNHPEVGEKSSNQFGALGQMISGKFLEAGRKLNIQGHKHGIANGWFLWPANFDPVWLVNCDGFESKKKK